jgi:glycosyl transferase family 9 (putative heptosyltransferase)
VLVLRPGALGDTLLAVPALRALRRSYSPLRLAAHGAAARLLVDANEISAGLSFDDPSMAWLFNGRAPDEPLVAWMTPSPAAEAALGHALLVAPSRPEGEEHCARYLLRSLAPLGIDLRWDDHPLAVVPLATDEVLVHPGSGSPAKNWPADAYAQVIANLDAPVRLIVGEADTTAADAVEAALGRSLPRLEHPPLMDLARRLAGCRAYLGNDSGVSHLAGLCGARTVALFGPTSPRVWSPIGPNVKTFPFGVDTTAVVRHLVAPLGDTR